MNTAGKIAAFAAALAVAFSGAYGIGAALDPVSSSKTGEHDTHGRAVSEAGAGGAGKPSTAVRQAERLPGPGPAAAHR